MLKLSCASAISTITERASVIRREEKRGEEKREEEKRGEEKRREEKRRAKRFCFLHMLVIPCFYRHQIPLSGASLPFLLISVL